MGRNYLLMPEEYKKKVPIWKSKKSWLVIGILFALGIFLYIGHSVGQATAKVELEDGEIKYNELNSEIDGKKTDLLLVSKNLEDLEKKLDDKSEEVDEALALTDKTDDLNDEVNQIKGDLSDKKDELDALNDEIESKKDKLNQLEEEGSESEKNESTEAEPTVEEDVEEDVPREYKSALSTAETYANSMDMSKAGIYDQLVSPHGEDFPEDAAQYAIDNIEADWKQNALNTAKTYAEEMDMSDSAIYDQLISDDGEKFTAEEAQYAIDNLE